MRRKKKHRKSWRAILLVILLPLVLCSGYYGFQVVQSAQRVIKFEAKVRQAAEDTGIKADTTTLLAIMMTESKGRGTDLMQSSESLYGEVGQITSQEQSIRQGATHFSEVLQQADEAGCDFWTAVQAYNFGSDYINYVKKNGGKNSVELAETYSRDVLSPLLGNTDQTQYRYWKIRSLFYNGGYLYQNGGNMFYADLVKLNQKIIEALLALQS